MRDYVDHVKSTVPFSLDGLRIAIDCANGASCRTAETLFTELGAECRMLANEPNGVNVNDKCGSTHMEALMEYVKTHDVDAGIAFDGDADRCLAVDENGNFVDGDFIMAICAADMKSRGKLAKSTVVGTIMTNMGFNRFCGENDMKFAATKVGDRYVLEEMLLEGYNFGGEQSGHVIFLDFATTGDGQMTAAQLLSIMRRREAKLSSLATIMQRYPQVMVNVKTSPEGKLRFYTDTEVKESIESESGARRHGTHHCASVRHGTAAARDGGRRERGADLHPGKPGGGRSARSSVLTDTAGSSPVLRRARAPGFFRRTGGPPAAFEVQRDRVLKDQKATACEKVRRTAALFPQGTGVPGQGGAERERGPDSRTGQESQALPEFLERREDRESRTMAGLRAD